MAKFQWEATTRTGDKRRGAMEAPSAGDVEARLRGEGLTIGKIKKGGGKYLSKGVINGQELGVFFPTGATRFIRITKPTCGITILRVLRSGDQLSIVAAADADTVVEQRIWP